MATPMTLKARVMDPRAVDDISDALKDLCWPRRENETDAEYDLRRQASLGYFSNYYPEGLREAVLGPHSRQLVGVSRYYPTLTPPVVVDFEPAPPDPWYLELKQAFCFKRGILLVPIYLQDRLTTDDFALRYREAAAMVEDKGLRGEMDAAQLPQTDVEGILVEYGLVALIEQRARALTEADMQQRGRAVFGSAKNRMIKKHRDEVVAQMRKKLRHGMDRDQCYRELTDPLERQGDGQVHPPIAGRSGA